ncbi:MAG: response regulator transcription factor [Deltaproteobacteria bacterium]|nr:response regulator transcription factor [Deltaproteobacteria bacterium]
MERMGKYRVVIAEDHAIVRDALRVLLSAEREFEVVADASDGRDAIRCALEHAPDLVLVDLSMPRMGGVDAIKEIKRCCRGTKVLVLTAHRDEEHVFASLQAGADGYVLKEATAAELLLAARGVLAGKTCLSPEISRQVVDGYLEARAGGVPPTAWDTLTDREKQILKMIAEGHKNMAIAEYHCISEKTVERHRANLMAKLDLHSASALTTYAMEKGLVSR